VLAAYRAGLKTLLVPKSNKKDLVDVPRKVQRGLNFVFVERMDEVLPIALISATKEKDASPPTAKNKRSMEKHDQRTQPS